MTFDLWASYRTPRLRTIDFGPGSRLQSEAHLNGAQQRFFATRSTFTRTDPLLLSLAFTSQSLERILRSKSDSTDHPDVD